MNLEEIISIIGLATIIICHLCTTVWWMSKITANQENMTKEFQRMANAMIKLETESFSRNEALRELGRIEAVATKAHARIDFMNETVIPRVREEILRVIDNNHKGG